MVTEQSKNFQVTKEQPIEVIKAFQLQMRNLVEDKTISLVGPANYMLGSSHGAEIEASDVVVRLNRGFETCKKYTDDLGNRTDILYSCLIEKQAKNRNETCSKLSLGIRLRKVKRIRRKRCCDTTPDRCLVVSRFIILFRLK